MGPWEACFGAELDWEKLWRDQVFGAKMTETNGHKLLFFYLSRSSWPRTPGPATAFPNLILVQNKPPMVALWLPNAASESLEKKKFVSICLGHLGPEHLVPPQLFPI